MTDNKTKKDFFLGFLPLLYPPYRDGSLVPVVVYVGCLGLRWLRRLYCCADDHRPYLGAGYFPQD